MCTLGFHLLTYSMWEVFVFDPCVPLHEDTTACGFQLVAVFVSVVRGGGRGVCFTVVSKHFIANTWERSC